MEQISNINIYNERMSKSLIDKAFFLDKVEGNNFVDFGCADGTLIYYLFKMFPFYCFYGYDTSEEMIKIAKNHFKQNFPDDFKKLPEGKILPATIDFTTNYDEIAKTVKRLRSQGIGNSVLILSSIIHEVYSYSNTEEIDSFWNRVFSGDYKYIVVRDMLPKHSLDKKSDINDVIKLRRNEKYSKELADFENIWGSIENNKNLVHFLLKYRYENNWKREVKENYFPLYAEEFQKKINENYDCTYYEEFVLPFTKTQIKNDFDVDLKDTTQVKCILKLKDNIAKS